MITAKPLVIPIKNPMKKKDKVAKLPTAPKALSPIPLPTMAVSATAYIC
jgi:hypothetical protein